MKRLSRNYKSEEALFIAPRKSVAVSFFLIFLFSISTMLVAAPQNQREAGKAVVKTGPIETKIDEIDAALKEGLKNEIDILKLKFLVKELEQLEKADKVDETLQEKIKETIKRAEDQIKAAEPAKSLSDLIGGTKPLTAVLFSTQDRNVFEIVRKKPPEDGTEPDETIGQISQSQEGDTGGILIAAEAPFLFSKTKDVGWLPIGAWFGVRLQTGGGSDINDVDLASGLSFSFLRKKDLEGEISQFGKITSAAKLLIGAIYGDVVRLGGDFEVGNDFKFGEAIPLTREKDIEFTMGIGFRF